MNSFIALSFLVLFVLNSIVQCFGQINICPNGTLSSGANISVTDNITRSATKCTISGFFSVSGESLSSKNATTRESAFVSVSCSTITSGSRLRIIGPASSIAAGKVPFLVSISNNVFGAAVIHFSGSLPPYSLIVIANNTMTAGSYPSFAFKVAILIGAAPVISLGAFALIVIRNNTINASSAATTDFISFASITLEASSSVEVRGNTVHATVSSEIVFVCLLRSDVLDATPASQLSFVGNYSSFVVAENSYRSDSGKAWLFLLAPEVRIRSYADLIGTRLSIVDNTVVLASSTYPTIQVFDGEVKVGILQISGNSFTVGAVGNSFRTIEIMPGGSMEVSSNKYNLSTVDSSSSFITTTNLILEVGATVVLQYNTFTAPGSYYLLNAAATSIATPAPAPVVLYCDNNVTNVINPSSALATRAQECLYQECVDRVSPSGTLTNSSGQTISDSQDPSASQSMVDSDSLTKPLTPSLSTSITTSASSSNTTHGSGTATHAASGTRSSSGTPNTTETRSISASPSPSASPGNFTRSDSPLATASLTASHSCLETADLIGTCSVIRPLPSSWGGEAPPTEEPASDQPLILDHSWRYGSGDCTAISIPFGQWAGRPGVIHTIGIAALDPRVPILGRLPPPALDTNLITAVSQRLITVPISLMKPLGNGSTNVTALYPTAVVSFRYDGKQTLNRVAYRINCSAWMRCPVAAPMELFVTLEASQRLLPVAVAEAAKTGSAIVSLMGGLTISPSAVAQLGVVTSLRKISRCATADLSEDSADGSYDDYMEGVLNPFSISIGGGGGRRYIRGALVMSLVYLVGLSALMFAFTSGVSHIRHLASNSASRPTKLLVGYPSVLVAVASFVMDGASAAGTLLGAHGDRPADKVVGFLCVGLCLAYIGHIVLVTTTRFPTALSPTKPEPTSIDTNDGRVPSKVKEWYRWLTRPTHQWQHGADSAAGHWLGLYESYTADVHVRWYCGLEQGVALLVCVLGSLYFDDATFCVARGSICVLALAVQTLVMIVLRPVLSNWRWLLLSIVLTGQTASAALSVANVALQQQSFELAMDAIGVAVFILLGMATVSDTLLMFFEHRATARRALAAFRKRGSKSKRKAEAQPTRGDSTILVDMADLSSTDFNISSSLLPPADAPQVEATEEETVKMILMQFVEYNDRLDLASSSPVTL